MRFGPYESVPLLAVFLHNAALRLMAHWFAAG
jgi:hypothetical protein